VLAAMAVFAKKPSTIHGTHRLTHKESNRALSIQQEFAKAGIQVDLVEDKMIIHPGKVQKATLHSHHDHRIAMAAAILGLAGAPITIEDADAVGKSYPDFFADLSDLGAEIEVH
jgi:3-phosphoshikimate 1-carboxyvinyltransferase